MAFEMRSNLKGLFLLLCTLGVASAEGCSRGWVQFEDNCYRHYNDTLTFYEALQVCDHFFGAKPLMVRSEAEHKFVQNYLKDRLTSKLIWLGAKGFPGEDFQWLDNSPLDYRNWDDNEPSFIGGREFCIVMSLTVAHKGKWINLACSSTLIMPSVVCKKSSGAGSGAGSGSESRYQPYNSRTNNNGDKNNSQDLQESRYQPYYSRTSNNGDKNSHLTLIVGLVILCVVVVAAFGFSMYRLFWGTPPTLSFVRLFH